MTVFMNNESHYDLYIRQEGKGIRYLELKYRLGSLLHTEVKIKAPEKVIYLQVQGSPDFYTFSYSLDGMVFKTIGKMNVRFISSETSGGFTGIYLGNYICSESRDSKAYADFDWFRYTVANK